MADRRPDWRMPHHTPGDCIAGVPADVLARYEREGPALEAAGELRPVPPPAPGDFENPRARANFRGPLATP
jgi:hypothetical protein